MPSAKKKRPAPKPVNPYETTPIKDFIDSSAAGITNLMPFSGVADRAAVEMNQLRGSGPQSLTEMEAHRRAMMDKSPVGKAMGNALGFGANFAAPEGFLANLISGGVEGGTADPEQGFSPGGAALGTGLGALPIFKLLKLDPRGIPPESFVRTKLPKVKEFFEKDIMEMIKEHAPRKLGVVDDLKKLFRTNIPANRHAVASRVGKMTDTKQKAGKNFYETGSHLMNQQEIAAHKEKYGHLNFYDPKANLDDFNKQLKQNEGLSYGTFASSNIPEAVKHEGIHSAFQHAAEKSGLAAEDIEEAAAKVIAEKYPLVWQGMSVVMQANGYDKSKFATELLPHMSDILSNPADREKVSKLIFGDNKEAYKMWTTQTKKAYREIVEWAKHATPEQIKKLKGK